MTAVLRDAEKCIMGTSDSRMAASAKSTRDFAVAEIVYNPPIVTDASGITKAKDGLNADL